MCRFIVFSIVLSIEYRTFEQYSDIFVNGKLKCTDGGADKILDQSKWFRRHPICFLMKSAEKL